MVVKPGLSIVRTWFPRGLNYVCERVSIQYLSASDPHCGHSVLQPAEMESLYANDHGGAAPPGC
jgi:hypothetical protein